MKDAMDELVQKYSRWGHPSAEELIAEQGLTFPRDPRDLLGDFWPEEESLDDFLAAKSCLMQDEHGGAIVDAGN
jgi:hypothetical protein